LVNEFACSYSKVIADVEYILGTDAKFQRGKFHILVMVVKMASNSVAYLNVNSNPSYNNAIEVRL